MQNPSTGAHKPKTTFDSHYPLFLYADEFKLCSEQNETRKKKVCFRTRSRHVHTELLAVPLAMHRVSSPGFVDLPFFLSNRKDMSSSTDWLPCLRRDANHPPHLLRLFFYHKRSSVFDIDRPLPVTLCHFMPNLSNSCPTSATQHFQCTA